MKNAKVLDDVVFAVVRENKEVKLNCNGNFYTVTLNEHDELVLINPYGVVCEKDIYGLVRFLNNTVVDEYGIFGKDEE